MGYYRFILLILKYRRIKLLTSKAHFNLTLEWRTLNIILPTYLIKNKLTTTVLTNQVSIKIYLLFL